MAAQQTVDSQSTASSTEEQLVSPRTSAQQDEKLPPQQQPSASHSLRFWGIFVALCILSFICALDVIIITTALPTITASIGGAKQYVWIANSFVIASSVLQLLFGQLADIFGRKTPLIASSALFILGSGLAGGASNAAGLIAGRTVQGVGAGGLYVLLDIVCCDLVPLRERGKYVGLMNSFAGVAAAIGPAIGGAIAQANWRWIFYLNIPICGLALGGLVLFMRMNKGNGGIQQTWKSKLGRVDYLGNLLFVPSVISVLLGLVMGGIEHPWSSWRIVIPLVLGIVGWIGFHVLQSFVSSPSVPTRLFNNRTSAIGYVLTFLSSVLIQAISYFLPVYFQAVKGTTVLESGTFFLPYAIGTLFFAIVGGVMLSTLGKYKLIHAAAFGLSAIGIGLFTLLDSNTSKVAWVFYQLITSAGLGLSVSAMLPAIMAGLPESDVASITALYAFVRTFGYVWGVTLASIIFNAAFNSNLQLISDSSLRDRLANGAAYAFASEVHGLRGEFSPEIWGEVQQVYMKSLNTIWWVCLGISIVGFCAVWGERSLELRTELETEYGLEERAQEDATLEGQKPQTTQ